MVSDLVLFTSVTRLRCAFRLGHLHSTHRYYFRHIPCAGIESSSIGARYVIQLELYSSLTVRSRKLFCLREHKASLESELLDCVTISNHTVSKPIII